MSGGRQRIDGKRDQEVAAAYLSGLSLVECAVKFSTGRGAVKGALKRTGTPFRRRGRPARPRPWAAEAAARHLAGESASVLGRAYGVDPTVMRRAIRRQGVTVTPGPRGRPRGGAG